MLSYPPNNDHLCTMTTFSAPKGRHLTVQAVLVIHGPGFN